MVEWVSQDRFGIEDIDQRKMVNNLMSIFKDCLHENDRELGMRIDGVYVIGSVARGEAVFGESDIDIVVEFNADDATRLEPGMQMAVSHVANCMEDRWKEIVPQEQEGWLDGVDIIDAYEDTVNKMIERFSIDTRDGSNYESGYSYNLIEQKYHR